jgi:hypothetical protein
MIEQVSNAVKFLAFYTASKQGKTGLTVTIDIYNPSGTQIVTAASATAIGGGLYSYTLTSNNSSEGEYAAIFKTTDSTVDSQHIPSLWVLGRAGVENLDAATSTRLPSSSYTAPANSDISAIKSKTDALPSDPADQSLVEAAITALSIPTVVQIRTEMDSNSTKLANLDATVSSRLAPNGTLATVTTLTNAPSVPTAAEIATAVEGSLLNEADGQAVLNAIVGAIGNTNLSEVSLVAAVRADLERTGGKLDSIPTTAAPTAAQNATAVWGAATRSVTGGTVDTLTNAPASVTPSDIWSYNARTLTSASGPTAVQIRQEMDSNSSQLSAIKAKTDNLPADPADQSLLEAAIAGVTAPSASQVASQVRTELSSELAKVAALNTERLANVATTAIVGNLIAQANS